MLLGKAGEYLTFKQVQSAGGRVRKGEKSHMVVFWKFLTVEDEDTKEEKQVPLLRYYNVFHIDQCEGITAKHIQPLAHNAEPDKEAERLISDYCARAGVTLIHQEGDKAFYRPSNDTIVLPMMSQFAETAEYYSTAFHEMVHSTGHSNRLNRLNSNRAFRQCGIQQGRIGRRNWRVGIGQSRRVGNRKEFPQQHSICSKLAECFEE